MPTNYPMSLPLIQHTVGQSVVPQRASDSYINATEMCKACNKFLGHYLENKTTKACLNELSSDIGIPTSELFQVFKGGNPQLQGTWVHP